MEHSPARCPNLDNIVTLDYLVAIDGEVNLRITGDIDAFTIKDLWSGYTPCYPMPDNSADRVVTAINHFHGSRNIELLYGDNAKEIRKAAEVLRINLDNT